MKDQNVYRKKDNGRYEAIGLQYDRDWLGDGIWHVSHKEGSTSIRNLSYYGGIYKVGDAEYPDFSKLAGVLEIADLVASSDKVNDIFRRPHSIMDICNTIISEAVKVSEDIKEKSKNRPLKVINQFNLESDGFTREVDTWKKRIEGTWYRAVITPNYYNNPRYSKIDIFSTTDDTKVAEFRAEYLHQVYQFVLNL